MAAAAQPLMTLPQLAQFAGGDLMVRDVPSGPIEREAFLRSGFDGVTLDTRTIQGGELFVPLAGSQADGHAFLGDAFRRGAAAALCARARYAEWRGREPGPLVVVDDVTEALQRLAHRHRESWNGLLLGVTGSTGKTTTKDLVALALAAAAPTLKTEGNLNNHWGVPLTLLRLRAEHRAAVVEMGTSGPGEIAFLAALAAPGAAVLTNAGHAHLEGLGSLEAIATEKASLAHALQKEGVAFAGADSPRLIAALEGVRCKLVRYGLTRDADVRPTNLAARADGGTSLDVEGFPRVELKLVGRHQVANALAALAVAREWRIDPGAVAAALSRYRGSKGRMEVRHARGATLLVDTYNANPDSTRAALETLAAWPGATRRIAVLGDMLELGEGAATLHRDAGAAARDTELWAIGAHAMDYAKGAQASRVAARTFADFPALRTALGEALAPGVTVLLKASRGAALERALEGLEMED
jgi:UDP-N-acetylmuramoyl-tripeptide--D-alanyl-D-alanine ligase